MPGLRRSQPQHQRSLPHVQNEQQEGPEKKRRTLKIVWNVLTWVLVAIALFLVWPHSLGGKVEWVVVVGESMEPTFHTGDVVLVANTGDYEIGDTVLYAVQSPNGDSAYNVIHRLVQGNPEDGWYARGDNKPRIDPWLIQQEAIQGEEWFLLPQLGNVILWFRQGPFLALLAGALVTAAILAGPSVARRKGELSDEDRERLRGEAVAALQHAEESRRLAEDLKTEALTLDSQAQEAALHAAEAADLLAQEAEVLAEESAALAGYTIVNGELHQKHEEAAEDPAPTRKRFWQPRPKESSE